MTTAGAAGRGTSPLIADDSGNMPRNDFSEFLSDSDELFGAASPLPVLDFSDHPDSLHQFADSTGQVAFKSFLSPQPQFSLVGSPNPAVSAPDSPSGSFRDSQSESSKRSTSSVLSKTAALTAAGGDVMMTDGPIKAEWVPHGRQDEDMYLFGGAVGATGVTDMAFEAFPDEKFMDEAFDFESASSSPNAVGGDNAASIASPDLALSRNTTAQSSFSAEQRSLGHNKTHSQFSLTQGMNGLKTSGSRGGSPMSNLAPSQNSSPPAVFNNSPSPMTHVDFPSGVPMGNAGGHSVWPSNLDMAADPMSHGLAIAQPFTFSGMPQVPVRAQVSNFNAFSFNGNFSLEIAPTPAKSRVETQIPIKMILSPPPPHIKRLHLPTHTISKPKLLAKPSPERSPDMLELYTMLVCTSAMLTEENRKAALERAAAASHSPLRVPSPSDEDESSKTQNGGEVRICEGCITRERKRAARKKIKKHEEEEMWSRDESRRVIVFNTQEIKEWQPMTPVVPDGVAPPPQPLYPINAVQVDAPMRIACYCRHHGEKSGFQVIFTIKDWQDRVVAQAFSPSIMITDDHKTPAVPVGTQSLQSTESLPQTLNTVPETAPLASANPFRLSHSSSDLQSLQRNAAPSFPPSASIQNSVPTPAITSRTLSRPASPTGHPGPLSKKRKSSGPRIAMDLNMTPLDTTSPTMTQTRKQAGSTATSPFLPTVHGLPSSEVMFGQGIPSAGVVPAPFATGPPTPNSNDQALFSNANRSASMDNMSMPQMYSAPTSTHGSRAPSPNGLRNSVNAMMPLQFGQQVNPTMFPLPMNMTQARPLPTIFKIIPNEGPKSGGIEVTLLGQGFWQGLEVVFGDQKATTTTYWGEQSLVCLLPPSPIAGAVPVTLKQPQSQPMQPFNTIPGKQPLFKYVDDDEDKLIRTALSVLGQKMSGQMEDVCDLARRILGESTSSGWRVGSSQAGSQGGGPSFTNASQSNDVESQLLRCLDLIDLDDSSHRTRLDLRRSTGQTMLHLACARGFHRLVAGLLARGANPDIRDRGGFTPMHLAAMNDQPEIVRRLIQVGADPTIRSLSGLAPADVSQSRNVLRAIRRVERQARSGSGGGSLQHSRANSAASLRSLWEPPTQPGDAASSSGESPEYSSEDYEDTDGEDQGWLNMRRPSTFGRDLDRSQMMPDEAEEIEPTPPSPNTAVAGAFNQLQQTMAFHLQNLQQMNFPQMPGFSGMPMLPDYQAYVSAAFVARLASLVPGMSTSRPDSSDDESPKAMDSWWWRSFNMAKEMPPAYEDIYPQGETGEKRHIDVSSGSDSKTLEGALQAVAASSSKEAEPLKLPRKATVITHEVRRPWLAAYNPIRSTQDKKLFFIWIPLLLCMICALAYSYLPPVAAIILGFLKAAVDYFERIQPAARETLRQPAAMPVQ